MSRKLTAFLLAILMLPLSSMNVIAAEGDPDLSINEVYQSYSENPCLKNITFNVSKGEIISLLGPSGSGKTTILRSIAGLERIISGKISIDDKLVSSKETFIPPERRKIGFVFQDYALFPHLNVLDNILFGLKRALNDKLYICPAAYPYFESLNGSFASNFIPEKTGLVIFLWKNWISINPL